MDDLARFCCQNPDCPLFSRHDADNLSVCARYGKHDPIRLLYCKGCKYCFSERKGTPLFHCHLPEEKAHSVLHHPPDSPDCCKKILSLSSQLYHRASLLARGDVCKPRRL
jgi:hypothetical protein